MMQTFNESAIMRTNVMIIDNVPLSPITLGFCTPSELVTDVNIKWLQTFCVKCEIDLVIIAQSNHKSLRHLFLTTMKDMIFDVYIITQTCLKLTEAEESIQKVVSISSRLIYFKPMPLLEYVFPLFFLLKLRTIILE